MTTREQREEKDMVERMLSQDIGQAELTEHEIERLPMGNQHTKWNVVRWQVVKAHAMHHNVPDWTAKVDTSLTYEENVSLMKKYGTHSHPGAGPSMRELPGLTAQLSRGIAHKD